MSAAHSRCHLLGVCVLDANCQRRFECATEAREAGLPIQYAEPEPEQEEPLLHAEGCQCWLSKVVILVLGVSLGGVLGLHFIARHLQ